MLTRNAGICRWLALAVMVAVAGCPAWAADEPIASTSSSVLGNKDVGKSETAVGDLFADAARALMRTQIAFVAASELKARETPFASGKIASSDLEDLVSYPSDPLATLDLTGKMVRQALERSVSIHPQPNLGFLQVSGVKFSFDDQKPSGSRVTSVTVDGMPIVDDTVYRVAVSNSVANGALGYWKVWDSEKVRTTRDPKTSLVKAIQTYLQANPRIDYSTVDRISAGK